MKKKNTPITIEPDDSVISLANPTITIEVFALGTKMFGTSLNHLKRLVHGFAVNGRNLLFVGEPGTGKELLAEIYAEASNKTLHPFNCAGVSEESAASALFGHIKGAYTGAIEGREGLFPQDGFIFLDEMGAATPNVQAQLLRVLETGDYSPLGSDEKKRINDAVVCAATSEPGNIRRDLRDRFITLYLPTLRERRGDIPELVKMLLADKIKFISCQALNLLKQHDWPGNIRELGKVLQVAVDLASFDRSDTIRTNHLPTLGSSDSVDESRKRNVSKSKSEAIILPRETFFKQPETRDLNIKKFWADPETFKKEFYSYFNGYTATELNNLYRRAKYTTLRDGLKRSKKA